MGTFTIGNYARETKIKQDYNERINTNYMYTEHQIN